jgi:hypothetical protein
MVHTLSYFINKLSLSGGLVSVSVVATAPTSTTTRTILDIASFKHMSRIQLYNPSRYLLADTARQRLDLR